MASTDNAALASKILLMRANNKSKVKAWLGSTPDEANTQEPAEGLADLKGDNENAGIGVQAVEDDPLNRQLSSANDTLRRKLLSKSAYDKYQQKSAMSASKPMPKQAKPAESSDEDEGKGKGRPSKVTKTAATPKKRHGSYLDQLLAERSKKKSKG